MAQENRGWGYGRLAALDLLERQNLRKRVAAILPELKPRPNTGRLWHDVLFLLLMTVIQVFILPALLGSHLKIDLITPWLAITFIRQPMWTATILAAVGALALETHSSVPAGLYLCAYWIMANVILYARPTLSWRHRVPWLVTYGASATWIILFETFVIAFTVGLSELGLFYWLLQLVRFGIAVGFGMILCREWLAFQAEEPVPS